MRSGLISPKTGTRLAGARGGVSITITTTTFERPSDSGEREREAQIEWVRFGTEEITHEREMSRSEMRWGMGPCKPKKKPEKVRQYHARSGHRICRVVPGIGFAFSFSGERFAA